MLNPFPPHFQEPSSHLKQITTEARQKYKAGKDFNSMRDSLINRLNIINGASVKLINEPNYYFDLLGNVPEDVKIHKKLDGPVDMIHLFTRTRKELMVEFPVFKKYVSKNGALWISWPKKSSNLPTDLNEEIVKNIGNQNEFTGLGLCDFDETWLALKFEKSKGGKLK